MVIPNSSKLVKNRGNDIGERQDYEQKSFHGKSKPIFNKLLFEKLFVTNG